MEDGFIRSVGLGSNMVHRASMVIDDRGIYCDPMLPSWLEAILNAHDIDNAMLARAGGLRQMLIEQRISK